MAPTGPPRQRWKKIKRLFIAGLISLAATVCFLPWLASTAPGRIWILATANRAIAPSRIQASSIRLSWFGSQEAANLVLRDRGGKAIVSVPRAVLRRGLLGLALERPLRADVLLDGGVVDIERREDGSIDLVDALAPLASGESSPPAQPPVAPAANTGRAQDGPNVMVRLVKGSITVRSPELAAPITARSFGMTIRLPSGSEPLTCQLALAEPSPGDRGALQIDGRLDRRPPPGGSADVEVKFHARSWPLAVSTGGLSARGRVDGDLGAARKSGRWEYTGKTNVLELDADGPTLAGDRLKLPRMDAEFALGYGAEGWTVGRLDVVTPLGSIKTSATKGTASPTSAMRLEGQLDLAALAQQLPHALRVREGLVVKKGLANVVAEVGDAGGQGGTRLAVDARISELLAQDNARTIAIRDPATVSARLLRRSENVQVERLAVKTAFLDASGSGDLESGIRVSATIDLAGLENQLHELVDFGALKLAGRGRLAADYRRTQPGRYFGRLSAEVRELRVAGLTEQPIARHLFHVDASAAGPLAEGGMPQAWTQTRLAINTDDMDSLAALSTNATDGSFQIDELRVAMQVRVPSAAPNRATESVRFTATGRFESGTGTLVLKPRDAGAKPEPVVLAGDGVRAVGLRRGGDVQLSGALAGDLARLDRVLAWWTSSPPMDLAGAFSAKGGITWKATGGLTTSLALNSPDMSLPPSEGTVRRPFGPVLIGINARRPADLDRIDFESLAIACRYANVHARGNIQEPGGRRVADLGGTIAPNWKTIDPVIAEWVEPRARIRAVPRPFHVRGAVPSGGAVAILQGLQAEVALDGFEAVAFGARVAPTPVVVHWKGRQGVVEPITTTINGGQAILRPDFAIDDRGTLSFRLAQGSSIKGAEINDEVSKTLLAYVAPVLHDSSQVRGKVTVEVSRADFPLLGDDPSRRSTLIGRVEFDDVSFSAGPLASELVSLSGNRREAVLRLNQPVELAIADGRVNQRGFSLPLGRDAWLELEGSVGFDKTLAMRARVPVNPGIVSSRGDVNELLEGLRVGIPIGGTLSRPRIDRSALSGGLRDAGKTAIKRGAADILKRLATPDRDDRPQPRRGR